MEGAASIHCLSVRLATVVSLGMGALVHGSCASGPPPGDYEQALRESRAIGGEAPGARAGDEAAGARDEAAGAETAAGTTEASGAGASGSGTSDGSSDDGSSDESSGDAEPRRVLRGQVSYYADSLAGNSTASGEPYDPSKLTAASRDLPFGTVVRVVRVDNGRSVRVRINDRGPFGDEDRILDVSRAAAERLGMIREGVVDARVEVY